MKKVMEIAWKIARKGQNKFGGKVSEYLAIAMKQAWAIVKRENASNIFAQYAVRGNVVGFTIRQELNATVTVANLVRKGQGATAATGERVTLYKLTLDEGMEVVIHVNGYAYIYNMDAAGALTCTYVRNNN